MDRVLRVVGWLNPAAVVKAVLIKRFTRSIDCTAAKVTAIESPWDTRHA